MNKPTQRWAFFSYAHNLGDFSRALETAKGIRAHGHELSFFNHGGTHIGMIDKEGMPSVNLDPPISDEQDRIVMAINQFRAPIGTPLPFTEEELVAMVEADITALQDYKPDGVYCGLNISSMISVPYLKLPRVTMVPTTLCPAFYKKGLATFPNTMEKNFFVRNLIPAFLKEKFFNSIMLKDTLKNTVSIFNRVRKRYGLPPIFNSTEFVKSDLVILPDLPELSGLPAEELSSPYIYSGPIFYRMDLPIPKQVTDVFDRPGTNVFVSLGSSGSKEILKLIISTLQERKDINLVCSTTTIVIPEELGTSTPRFYAAPFLPSHLVNEMADIAFTHGGQGTIQTAAWSGTPVVGVGFQSEQQANIDGMVRAGAGIRLHLQQISKKSILKAFDEITRTSYRENAMKLRQLIRNSNGIERSVELMEKLISQNRLSK